MPELLNTFFVQCFTTILSSSNWNVYSYSLESFGDYRGTAMGILKAQVGLSGAIFVLVGLFSQKLLDCLPLKMQTWNLCNSFTFVFFLLHYHIQVHICVFLTYLSYPGLWGLYWAGCKSVHPFGCSCAINCCPCPSILYKTFSSWISRRRWWGYQAAVSSDLRKYTMLWVLQMIKIPNLSLDLQIFMEIYICRSIQ